ncbi:MAG TPA: helix-turn-helix domain-containing protein [Candidatus Aquilonibacter sp.]|nr:helix-turn-helix domain-containing protein [Candidatus Aquilonibacter sp.]
MKQNTQYILTGQMVRDLCAESPDKRLLHRLHCVALVNHGLSASEVGRIFKDSPRAVSYWVTRFKKDGIDGLREETRPGRPSKLNPPQMKKLKAFLKQSRAGSKPVKPETLSTYISNEFGIILTSRQCSRILKRLTA